MGRARFAEIGKRVPGGGKCNFSAKKEGKFHRPPPCRVGVITSSISGKPGTWDRLSDNCHQMLITDCLILQFYLELENNKTAFE